MRVEQSTLLVNLVRSLVWVPTIAIVFIQPDVRCTASASVCVILGHPVVNEDY